jgi:hypothetical protein
MTYQPGDRLVITDSTSMFYGEVGTVSNETSPYPDQTVWLSIAGWPVMSWGVQWVRPATPEDEARCAPVSDVEGGSAPQVTGPSPNARDTGAGGRSGALPDGGVTCASA